MTAATAPVDSPGSRLRPGTRTAGAGEIVVGARRVARPAGFQVGMTALVVVAAVGGVALLAAAQRVATHAAGSTASSTGGSLADLLFWLGLLLAVVPALGVVLARGVGTVARRTAVAGIALAMSAPTYLRTPTLPFWPEQVAALRTVVAVRLGASPFGVLGDAAHGVAGGGAAGTDGVTYPGLSALTALAGRVSGLSLWQTALLLVVVVHLALIAGVWALARTVLPGERAAAAAAVVAAVAPGTLLSTTAFGPLPIGLALAVWGVATFAHGAAGASSPRRWASTTLATLLILAAAMTSPLAGVAAAVAVIPVAAHRIARTSTRSLPPPHDPTHPSERPVVRLLPPLVVCVVVTAWSLTPTGRSGFTAGRFGRAARRAFDATAAPAFEPVISAIGFGVLGLLVVVGLIALRRTSTWGGRPWLAALWALPYPVSLVLLAAPTTAPIAHTAWPAVFLVTAPLVGAGLVGTWDAGLDGVLRRRPAPAPAASSTAVASASTAMAPTPRPPGSAATPASRTGRRDLRGRPNGPGRPAASRGGAPAAVVRRRERRIPVAVTATIALVAGTVLTVGGPAVGFGTADRFATTAAPTSSSTSSASASAGGPNHTANAVPTSELADAGAFLRRHAPAGFGITGADPALTDLVAVAADGKAVDVDLTAASLPATLASLQVGWIVAGRDLEPATVGSPAGAADDPALNNPTADDPAADAVPTWWLQVYRSDHLAIYRVRTDLAAGAPVPSGGSS